MNVARVRYTALRVPVDITGVVRLLTRLNQYRTWTEIRVTPLSIAARALVLAMEKFPEINGRWDDGLRRATPEPSIDLGILNLAPDGFVVHSIRGADQLNLAGLTSAIRQLKGGVMMTSVDQLDAVIALTDFSCLGVDGGDLTPCRRDTAMLGLGVARDVPWIVEGQIMPRSVMQLELSFDCRVIDDLLGATVLASVAKILRDPDVLVHDL